MAIYHGAPSVWDTVHFCCVFVSLALAGQEIYAHSANLYGDNGLQQTAIIDTLPNRQRREIKREILTLLGLDHKPKPVPNVKQNSAPQFMLDLYNSLQEDDEDIPQGYKPHHNLTVQHGNSDMDAADMVMSFGNHAGKAAKAGYSTKYLFYFDFSEVPATETVTGAELRIYKKPARKMSSQEPFLVQFYKLVNGGLDSAAYTLEPEVNISVTADERGWLHLDMKNASTKWTYFPAENHGLYMKITDKFGETVNPHDIGMVGRRGPEERQPFLVAFFKANQKLHLRKTRAAKREAQKEVEGSRRGKRRREEKVSYREERSPYSSAQYNPQSWMSQPASRCSRRALYVSFKDLGWQDWIIAPEGYRAYYCDGECQFPLHAHMNASNHAIVQALVRVTNAKQVPMPCCAPTKLSAKSVLYFDDNSNVILKKYRNMVNWIIAPEGYSAYYCYGQCQFPLHAHMNATNHAIVQVLVHITRRPSKPRPPMPCCAPRTLSPINVLYFDDNSNVILKKYRNMVAKECGCQ